MWTQQLLEKTIKDRMGDCLLVVVSQRQPYRHELKKGKPVCQREPGGLVTALNPVMQTAHGLWIASASTEYDRLAVDETGKVALPPQDPSYALRRIFLSKEELQAYYYGFCNEGLWPLCHVAYTRPVFRQADWEAYQQVNRKFADTILEEVGDRPAFVWIQDFHLCLVPKYLREAGKTNIITSMFWHIPWPNPEVFRICPQKHEILEGFLSCDLVGFHIKYHCDNFLATVDRELECRIDHENTSVFYQGRETLVRPFPVSVDFQDISKKASSAENAERVKRLREELNIGDRKLFLGVDRIDYTKGIPERLRAIDRFLEKNPEAKGKVVFLQLGQISRIHIQRYKNLNDEINALVEEINWKHSDGTWKPVELTRSYMDYEDILALYTTADICIVSSLHDGMNLVAKEYVACRTDESGCLLLSRFTGASRELGDALQINPFDTESFADEIARAFHMPREEQERRMRRMREGVSHQNIYRWVGKVLSQLLRFEFQEA